MAGRGKRCKDCVFYKRDPLRAAAVRAREEAGAKASKPMQRAAYGGWCHKRVGQKHPFMKVPYTPDLVDRDDWCADWKAKHGRDDEE